MKIWKVKLATVGEGMDFIFWISVSVSPQDGSILLELLPTVQVRWINWHAKASADETDSIIRVNDQSIIRGEKL